MKRISFLFIVAVVGAWGISHSVQAQELIQNGDFSNNTAGSTTYNMTNNEFTSTVAFCAGFGIAQEIDLIYDSDNGPPPLVGNTKLRIHRQQSGGYDAFSTTLLSPVVAGSTYRLQVDVVSRVNLETDLQVGISSSSSSFGTLLQSVPAVANTWTSIDVIVSAPVGGGYLTFRPDPDVEGIASVTNVSLTPAVDTTFSVGGSVAGLTGTGLALQNNATDTLSIAADGPFTFVTELADTAPYAVTVSTQPTGQTCSVTNGSGVIAAADVTNVAVTCVDDVVPTYSVGGTVSGLTGAGLALQNNAADTLPVAADGPFTFVTELADGAAYAVTVSTQPTGQTCSVTDGSGTIATADVTNVAVTCVDDVVPPATPAAPIPAASQWALIVLSMLVGLMVFVNRRRLF